MHDVIQLETNGIPAIMIVTDAFTESVRQQLKVLQFPSYRGAFIPHPIASLSPDEVKTNAEEVISQLVNILIETNE